MCAYLAGSAWAMARDIGEGYILPTERTYLRLSRGEARRLGFEIDRRLREVRAERPDAADHQALQHRNRRIQRLRAALAILRSPRVERLLR